MAAEGGAKQPAKGIDDLNFYQLALKLLQAAYKMAAELPDYEKYNLAGQVRRAALSAVLNMAEGYGRYHYLDKLRFFYIARGSLSTAFRRFAPSSLRVFTPKRASKYGANLRIGVLSEVRSAFTSARAVGYISSDQLQWAYDTEAEAQKSLNGYIGYLRRKQQGREEFGSKLVGESGVVYEVHLTPDAPDFPIP